jgi:hypothetical protein
MAPVLHAAQLDEAEPFQRGAGGERVWPRMGRFDCGDLGTVDLAPQIYLEW